MGNPENTDKNFVKLCLWKIHGSFIFNSQKNGNTQIPINRGLINLHTYNELIHSHEKMRSFTLGRV